MASTPVVFLPDDLIEQIFSCLPVKSLMRFKCLNKYFKTLISDSHFVQIHLNKSSRNPPHFALMLMFKEYRDYNVITFPISRLIENCYTIITIQHNRLYDNINFKWWVIGSCNGLLCLIKNQRTRQRLCLWNPATRKKSKFTLDLQDNFKFSFGYDSLNETYKVVALRVDYDFVQGNRSSMVKVFTMGDNSLRNIQCFPVCPHDEWPFFYKNNGVYLKNTINWLAHITVEQYVIVSLDLSTESYTQLLLPHSFDEISTNSYIRLLLPHIFYEVPRYEPKLVVLMDCLCFSHDFQESHFVIWQMKDFGVHESWTQLLKISYHHFHSNNLFLKNQRMVFFPLYLSKNRDTLILTNDTNDCFIYNCKDNTVEQTRITDKIWWLCAQNYVESLVSTP